MRRGVAFAGCGAGAFVAAFGAFAGCSLGLDASRIDGGAVEAGGGADGADLGDAPIDAASDGPISDGGPCARDQDCTSTDGCLVGRCGAGNRCVFDVCPTAACHAASCDRQTHTCSVPASYGFHATAIHVGVGGVGCGGVAAHCLAASYPFVFVGTTNGVVAYGVYDPSNPAPPPIPVTGLPFLPSWIVSTGGRVYFVGGAQGTGPTYKLPIGWLDVPADPLATKLAARTAFMTWAEPGVSTVLAAPSGSIFVGWGDAQKLMPQALATAPLQDLDTLDVYPSPGIPTGASIATASGSRLVAYRWFNDNGAYTGAFSFENAAATANAQNGGETSAFAAAGPIAPASTFAQTPPGGVLWMAPTAVVTDAGDSVIRGARMTWLVGDASASFDFSAHVDVETYAPPVAWGTAVAGPMAELTPTTALVLAAAPGTLGQTSVQVAVRAPAGLVPQHRYVIGAPVDQTGAAAGNGFGYVLAGNGPDSATVHVFAPQCAM